MAHIKFALPLAFLSGISGTCAFANSELPNTQGFIENSQFDVTLKNVWMINTNNQLSEAGIGDQNAWAQGALLDYQSGWYRDVIGINASWYSVVKLYANKDFAGRDLLRDSNGHAEGFNKVGQLYARLKWEDEQAYARLYAGWKQLYKFGTLSVTRSRAAPSSWQGVSLESGWGDLVARAAWVNRFSERDEPEKRRFYTLKSNKSIDHIVTGDISWSPDKSTRVSWVAGESDNYLLRQGVEAQFALPLDGKASLLFRSAWYYNRGLAEWEGARGFTHSAQHIFALVGYQYHAFESGVAWSKTKAPLENGLGHFYWHMGKNTRGAFNSPADGEGNDYVNDNEQMIYWYGKYVLSPELTTGIFANYGFGAKYQGVELTQWEYGGFIAWTPNAIPGLSLFAGFGPGYSWKQVKGQPWLKDDKRGFHRSHGIGGGITMEYKFGLHNQ